MIPTHDHQAEGQTRALRQPRALTCDEVSWLKHALESCAGHAPNRYTRHGKASRMATLIEVMEITGCTFLDDAARHNAISDFPELYQGARAEVPKSILSGADAKETADEPVQTAAPSPSAFSEVKAAGPGADAPTTAADGRSAPAANEPGERPKSSKPKKPKAAKKAKAKRERKVKEVAGAGEQGADSKESSVAEALQDAVPHTDPVVGAPIMDAAA